MVDQAVQEPEEKNNTNHILLLTAALLLPSVLWVVFGWTTFFLPLLLFVLIHKHGWRYTNRHLIFAVPAAMVGALLFQNIEFTLFALAFIPCGYVIGYCAQKRFSPFATGALGTAVIAITLIMFFNTLLPDSSEGFFTTMGKVFGKIVDEALTHYRDSSEYSAESYVILEQTLLQLKESVPAILPSIFLSFLMFINWGTIVGGNTVLPKVGSNSPWPEYKLWHLPDKLIWVFIAAAASALLSKNTGGTIAVNILLVMTVPYIFQGLAIIVYRFDKWNVPRFIRIFIYVMVFLQSFGTIALIILGLSDVWFDFRKIRISYSEPEQR